MNCLFMIYFAVSITEIATNDIKSKIDEYFGSESANTFEKQWRKHQISFEHTLNMALQQGYGHKSMNVYINRFQDPLTISVGYYHTDNQVHMVIQDMGLEELPHVMNADISFPLSSNVLSLDASVSKMIVSGTYVLFRNKSDIIFSVADQNPYESSPFRFQQVRNVGELAITIEGCTLSGIVIATLSGNTVHLGYDQFRLTDCQYNVEIHTPGTGAPPVMAPYLPKGDKRLNIEHLLMRPITEELVPKLKAAMFSYINTSAILTDKLLQIQVKQKDIFEKTKDYMDGVVRNMNEKAIETNMGTINMGDFTIVWDDPFEAIPKATTVTLSNMILMGLDTLYSSHTGGPFRLTDTEIAEQLRFSTLQVVGKISVKGFQDDNEFAVEILDFAVDVTIDSNFKATFDPVGWRYFDLSCPKMEFPPVESFIIGYLLNELPKRVTSHLNSVFNGGESQKLDLPIHDDQYEEVDAGDGKHFMNTDNTPKKHDDIEIEIEISDENNNDEVKNEKAIEKLNSDNTNNETIVKLHQLEIEPHFVEKGPIKLHHVAVEPYREDEALVQRHRTYAVPHNRKPGVELSQKVYKYSTRILPGRNKKILPRRKPKPVYIFPKKQIKPIKRALKRLNQTPAATYPPKMIHASDNEIH